MRSTINAISEVTDTDPMRREANKGLMVAWINEQLLDRASHDVRKSVVLYDEHMLFIMALPEGLTLTDKQRQDLYEGTPVRYWSRGIV